MWLSSTAPDITMWGGATGGGDLLRTGLAAAESSSLSCDDSGWERDGGEGEASLLDGPVGIIKGRPGVVRHVVLNNR